MQDPNSTFVSTPGSITNFLTPQFEIPPIKTNEQMGDVSGQVSKDISGKAGLDFSRQIGGGGNGSRDKRCL